MSSPWWYRWRSAVFALIYAVGFFGGWATAAGHRYVPTFAVLGSRLGHSGVPALLALAIAATLACLAVRAWGSSYLSADTVWNRDARTDSLLVCGPFRYTRNPLYVGNALLALGFGLLAPPWGAGLIAVANAFFIAALIRHEEAAMKAQYGAAFARYCAQVPRFFPRIVPAPPQGTARASIVQGVLSEVFTASLAAGLFAWVLAPAYGLYAFIALYVSGVFAQRAIERAQQSP